jgi:hypothetical protein
MQPLENEETTSAEDLEPISGPPMAMRAPRGITHEPYDDEPVPLSFAPPSSMLFILPLDASDLAPDEGKGGVAGTMAEVKAPDASRAILETITDLRDEAEAAKSAEERGRLIAYAKGLEDVLKLPPHRRYTDKPQIARELTAFLGRYRALPRLAPTDEGHREIVLKASIIAIHLALRLGYWRENTKVHPLVGDLLTAENVYGSALDVAMTRKSAAFDRLLDTAAQVITELKVRAETESESMLKVRNPTLWTWAKHNILAVTHYRRWSPPEILETAADAKLFLVLFNVLIDDVSDSIQHPGFLDVSTQIPRAGGAFGIASSDDYGRLRAHLIAIGGERFVPYFDLIVESWTSALRALEELNGEAYRSLKDQLGVDYDRIMQTVRFAVDLNNRPDEVWRSPPETLEQQYGGAQFTEILSHNANRSAFYTIDLMTLRKLRPDRFEKLSRTGSLASHRRAAALFQDMHQIGNSVSTRARETSSDDLSNGLFRIANDTLNARGDWQLPEHLAQATGGDRRDAILSAFMHKRVARRALGRAAPGTPEHAKAKAEDAAYAADLEQLIDLSGAEEAYFKLWVDKRSEAESLLSRSADHIEREELMRSNDMLLVLHLMYKGRI